MQASSKTDSSISKTVVVTVRADDVINAFAPSFNYPVFYGSLDLAGCPDTPTDPCDNVPVILENPLDVTDEDPGVFVDLCLEILSLEEDGLNCCTFFLQVGKAIFKIKMLFPQLHSNPTSGPTEIEYRLDALTPHATQFTIDTKTGEIRYIGLQNSISEDVNVILVVKVTLWVDGLTMTM